MLPLAFLLAIALPAQPAAPEPVRAVRTVEIPAGSFAPLYGTPDEPARRIGRFRLDERPVTRGEFLRFTEANAKWRRDQVSRLFADAAYLRSWPAAREAGDAESLRRPVTEVSWFAAKAYCESVGKRLPTMDEWEYVAAASRTERDASRDPEHIRQLLAVYAKGRTGELPAAGSGDRNAYGVRDMHGLVWEHVEDFNSVMVSDDSRGTSSGGERDHQLYCAGAAIGAADPTNYPAFLRYAVRAGMTGRTTLGSLGFRCAA